MRPFLIFLLWGTLARATTYSTNFPLSENPISENGNWINGGTAGIDWTNVRSIGGVAAYGTQPGNQSGAAQYADSTAVVAGSWGPDQTVTGTIWLDNAGDKDNYQEVELRLRTTIQAHSITGYEVLVSVSPDSNKTYLQVVRWNGALGDFTIIGWGNAKPSNGDTFSASIKGGTITVYLNGTQVCQCQDATFSSGSPGIGFYLRGTPGINADYGFSSVTMSDGGAPSPTPTPTPTPPPAPYAAWEAALLNELQALGVHQQTRNQLEIWMNQNPPTP